MKNMAKDNEISYLAISSVNIMAFYLLFFCICVLNISICVETISF